MVHLVGIGAREFSVSRLTGCRSPFTESTLTALGLWQPEVVCTNLRMQNPGKHEILPHPKPTTKSIAARRSRPPRDFVRRNTLHALAQLARFHRSRIRGNRPRTALTISKNHECYTYTGKADRQTNKIMAPCTHPSTKRLFPYRQRTASVASLPWPCLITSRKVNEARWPHACSRQCTFEERKMKKKNQGKIPPHRKRTTKHTSAQ